MGKTFFGLALYVAIGGVFVSAVQNHFVKKCGRNVSDVAVMAVALTWPALVVARVIGVDTVDTGCKVEGGAA